MIRLGIDIGGSGIKGALVDLTTGQLVAERFRLATPQPAKPQAVADVLAEIVAHFNWSGPIGCTFPAVIKRGIIHTATNIDPKWIGKDGAAFFRKKLGHPVMLLNDADAAGLAEMHFGVGRGHTGTVFMITFGTGVGSAIFVAGHLLPNTELGFIKPKIKIAEDYVSNRIRKAEDLDWPTWGQRVNTYLHHLDFLFSPDLFILGGGVSKKMGLFAPYLDIKTKVVPAQFRNHAGLIGAALQTQSLTI